MDDVLLFSAEDGKSGEMLRFWESTETFIVCGRTSNPKEDIAIEKARKDNVPILRRSSGGGTVLQGRGCLNFTLVLSKDSCPQVRTIVKSYEYILNKVVEALKVFNIDASFQSVSDLALSDTLKKFSGNAQKRGKKFILHHGTILYDLKLSDIEKYLKIPHKVPSYRLGRSHNEFITNIALNPHEFKKTLCQIFSAQEQNDQLTSTEEDLLKLFLATKEVEVSNR